MKTLVFCLGLLFVTSAYAEDGNTHRPRLSPAASGQAPTIPTGRVASVEGIVSARTASVVESATSTEAPAATPVVGAAEGNPLWSVPLGSLSATRERPLFAPSRRPPETAAPAPPPLRVAAPPPPPPPAAVAETPPFTLLGTVLGAGANFAVLLNTTTNEVKRLRLGESDAGWTAQKVEPRTAVLEKDGVENTLELPKTTDAPANALAAPAAADDPNN